MKYDYRFLLNEINRFPDAFSIGKTHEGRNIFCIPIGTGKRSAVFAAAFHGLEYLTTPALLNFAHSYKNQSACSSRLTLYIVPMVNPDGVEIAQNGLSLKNPLHRYIMEETGIIDFKNQWQANAKGVDINHNFDADWQSIYPHPSPTKYSGAYPESEPETRAVSDFLRRTKPDLFIAFHSQGKEIYYDFKGMENKHSKENAEYVAKRCGYNANTPTGTAAFGGAKDWYIKEYHKEAYTVELGLGKNPLPQSSLDEMIADINIICTTFINRVFT